MFINFIRHFLFFCIFIGNTYAINIEDTQIVKAEAQLLACQAIGHTLFASCVATPPDPKDVGRCFGIKVSYSMCISKLNAISDTIPNFKLDKPDMTGLYKPSPFSPCFAAISNLILPEICGVKPTP